MAAHGSKSLFTTMPNLRAGVVCHAECYTGCNNHSEFLFSVFPGGRVDLVYFYNLLYLVWVKIEDLEDRPQISPC